MCLVGKTDNWAQWKDLGQLSKTGFKCLLGLLIWTGKKQQMHPEKDIMCFKCAFARRSFVGVG